MVVFKPQKDQKKRMHPCYNVLIKCSKKGIPTGEMKVELRPCSITSQVVDYCMAL